jgi:hypothetical protein
VTGISFSLFLLSNSGAGVGGGSSDVACSRNGGCKVLMGRGEREQVECGKRKGEGLRGVTSMICRH